MFSFQEYLNEGPAMEATCPCPVQAGHGYWSEPEEGKTVLIKLKINFKKGK